MGYETFVETSIIIRDARSSDANACSEVFCESIRWLCEGDHQGDESLITGWCANKTPESVLQWIEQGPPKLFVAEVGTTLAAVGGVTFPDEVSLNYVSPQFTRQGVSRALLRHMEQALKSHGTTTAKLTSTKTALEFYQSMGWKIAGEIEACYTVEGFPMSKVL